ncbi:TonB-dependent siderophore receptor [Gemmobacter fulvus]|uniref:TonB-dependent siderophore receptor n=1 Tax=Gemmobacter fulvus TaxID=2840474 RepID=UPI0027965A25|nr:TonB-dependent siderophore receptor [Gemmobacter fulvus]MDQ1846771.1 TonB-dependent siderophore receptor [Gemmobacter fulvus]
MSFFPTLHCRRPRLALVLCGTILGAPALAQTTEVEFPPIVLKGQVETAVSGGTGYTAELTATGIKSGVPLTEVPQSVSVVTAQELADRDPVQIEDALAYSVGVTASPWGVDDRYDQFLIRGFDLGTSGIFRDGLTNKVQNFSGYKIDPFMVDRIDVLKGPASVLYGANDAAGMVNIISKRPVFERFTEARLAYGSHNTREAGLDTGGVLDTAGTLAWRLTALSREGANAVKGSQDDRDLLALGLTWAPSDATSITFLGHYQKDNLAPNSFLPVAGEDYDAALGDLPESFVNSQSPFNRFATEQVSFGWQAEHAFSENLTLRQNSRYAKQRTEYRHLYFNGMIQPDYTPDPDTMNFAAFVVPEEATTIATDTQLEYRSSFGGAESTLLIGADISRQVLDGTSAWSNPYSIDIANPNFDFPVAMPGVSSDRKASVDQKGLYVQEHLRFANGVTVTGGVRRSWNENEVEDNLTGTTSRQKDNATTAMLGATWDLGNGFIPYASYTESFTVNIGTDFAGDMFAPTEGRQYELGLRYVPDAGGLQYSAALFDTEKSNMLTADPDHTGYSVQTGEVRHRGLELEARGAFSEQLSGVVNYTYLDAEITRSNDGDQGNRTARVPEHQASAWLQYAFAGRMEGVSLGAGVRYVGETFGDNGNTRRVDDFLLADLSLRYEKDNYAVTLGATNLFDKDYFSTCDTSVGCVRGEGREVTLSLSTRF